jgi:Protein of unknown function (DUF2721)
MLISSGITDIAHSIQLAVAPVFLLTGVGTMLAVLTNRLARIIDRVRVLGESGSRASAPYSLDDQAELDNLSRRARLSNWAIALCTVCALLICLVIVALFASVAFGRDLSWLIVGLFSLALGAFIGGTVLFLFEVRMATASLRFARH